MNAFARLVAALLASVVIAGSAALTRAASDAPYWPGDRWRSSSPEAQGMDSAVLADALDYVQTHRTRIHSVMIIRNGYLVLDASFFPFHNGQLHDVASVTKSVTATLIGIVIGEGKLRNVNEPVLSVFVRRPVANRDDQKDHLTLEHLLTMSSGLDCEYANGERTLREMRVSADWVQFMLDRPMIAAPGLKTEYCSGGMHLLSGVVSQATGTNALEYARRRLFQPLGIDTVAWPHDSQGVSYGWGDLHLRSSDMAKLGYLWLNHGRWKNRQLIPSAWMAAAIEPHAHVLRDEYGYGLWVYPRRDPMVFEALGRGGQRISVVPSKHLVVVFTGGTFEPGDVGEFIGKAIRSDSPLPENLAASRRLAVSTNVAARPPAAEAASPLPAMAKQVSGRRYVMEANPLGWHAVTFGFDSTIIADAALEFDDGRVERRVVGLDGVPRLSAAGPFGLPVALQGSWTDSSRFLFDYDEVGNINAFVCRFTFEGKTATVDVKERSGLVDIRVGAKNPD
jgi:CubicO group peptidase (beta-lactamase class C family)